MVSSYSSLSSGEISAARVSPSQPLFFQLYKRRADELAERRVKEVEALGYKAIFLTVDALIPGHRERDIRAPFELEDQEREAERIAARERNTNVDLPKQLVGSDASVSLLGTSGALLANDDSDMTWERVCHLMH